MFYVTPKTNWNHMIYCAPAVKFEQKLAEKKKSHQNKKGRRRLTSVIGSPQGRNTRVILSDRSRILESYFFSVPSGRNGDQTFGSYFLCFISESRDSNCQTHVIIIKKRLLPNLLSSRLQGKSAQSETERENIVLWRNILTVHHSPRFGRCL